MHMNRVAKSFRTLSVRMSTIIPRNIKKEIVNLK